MKAIETDLIIQRFSSRVDKSLAISGVTPELSAEEKVAFIEMQNIPLRAIFYPLGTKDIPTVKVEKDLEQRTPSQRLRNVMYRCWEKEKDIEFEEYYRQQMERLIDLYKSKLDD